jgi:hypothetical protein
LSSALWKTARGNRSSWEEADIVASWEEQHARLILRHGISDLPLLQVVRKTMHGDVFKMPGMHQPILFVATPGNDPGLANVVEADVFSYLRSVAAPLGVEVVGPLRCPLYADTHPAIIGRCDKFYAQQLQQYEETGTLLSVSILRNTTDEAQTNLFLRIAARTRRYLGSSALARSRVLDCRQSDVQISTAAGVVAQPDPANKSEEASAAVTADWRRGEEANLSPPLSPPTTPPTPSPTPQEEEDRRRKVVDTVAHLGLQQLLQLALNRKRDCWLDSALAGRVEKNGLAAKEQARLMRQLCEEPALHLGRCSRLGRERVHAGNAGGATEQALANLRAFLLVPPLASEAAATENEGGGERGGGGGGERGGGGGGGGRES